MLTSQMRIEHRCAIPWEESTYVPARVASCATFYHSNATFCSSHLHQGLMLPNWRDSTRLISVVVLHLESRNKSKRRSNQNQIKLTKQKEKKLSILLKLRVLMYCTVLTSSQKFLRSTMAKVKDWDCGRDQLAAAGSVFLGLNLQDEGTADCFYTDCTGLHRPTNGLCTYDVHDLKKMEKRMKNAPERNRTGDNR